MATDSIRGRSTSPISPLLGGGTGNSKAGAKSDGVDFRSLLAQSNADVKAERDVKSKGDFSNVKDQEQFMQTLAEQSQGEPLRVPRNSMDKNDFLRLFVTQLQHQDPLKPKEGSEMAAELAQFNSLEQMVNINSTLDKLVTAQDSNRSVQLLNYIGQDVTLNHGRIGLSDKSPLKASYTVPAPVRQATLTVRNEAGTTVLEKELGNLNSGEHTLDVPALNGKGEALKPGTYFFDIAGVDDSENIIKADIQSKVKISGIDMNKTGGGFYTDSGKVNLDDIVAIGATRSSEPKAAGPSVPDPAGNPPASTGNESTVVSPEKIPTQQPAATAPADPGAVQPSTDQNMSLGQTVAMPALAQAGIAPAKPRDPAPLAPKDQP